MSFCWSESMGKESRDPEAERDSFEASVFEDNAAMTIPGSLATVSVNSRELAEWLAKYGPDAKERLESVAASTPRDNYGLVGKSGKKAKPKNDKRWESFQNSVSR